MPAYVQDEIEANLEEKARKKFNFTIEEKWEEGKAYGETQTDALIHASFGNGTAALEILTHDQLTHVVDLLLVKESDEEEEKKESNKEDNVLVKLYKSTKSDAFVLLPEEDLSGRAAKAAIRKILSWLKPKSILLLDSIYKTAYASFEYLSDANVLKFMKTSSAVLEKSIEAQPVEVTNGIGGVNGILLTHAEIHKIPAVLFMSVLDSYDFTLETYNVYTDVLKQSPDLKALAGGDSLPTVKDVFKPILKKYNTKKHNIYN